MEQKKLLVAEICIDSPKNTMGIYHYTLNGKSYWSVNNPKGEQTHCLCESFDQAVKYACEYLGLVHYKR
ncbi:MAG: hypothetical protein WC939_04155 [Acholeplasmataceae bacterium]